MLLNGSPWHRDGKSHRDIIVAGRPGVYMTDSASEKWSQGHFSVEGILKKVRNDDASPRQAPLSVVLVSFVLIDTL